jgi:hypothetical protein
VVAVRGHEVLFLQKRRDGQEEVRGLAVSVMNWSRQITKSSRASAALWRRVSGIWLAKLVCMKSAVVTGGVGRAVQRGGELGDRQVRGGAVRAASASNSGLRISRHGQLVEVDAAAGDADIAGQHAERR